MLYDKLWYILFLSSNIAIHLKLKIILSNFWYENIYFKPVHINLIFSKWLSHPRNDASEEQIPRLMYWITLGKPENI